MKLEELNNLDFSNLLRMSSYAKLKDITCPTVLRWIKEGKIKSFVIDNTVFIVDVD